MWRAGPADIEENRVGVCRSGGIRDFGNRPKKDHQRCSRGFGGAGLNQFRPLLQATVVSLGRWLRVWQALIARGASMAGRHRLPCGDRSGFSRDGGCRAQGKAGGGRRKRPNTQQNQQRSSHQRPCERDARHPECIGGTPSPLEAPILATRRVTRSAATPMRFTRCVWLVSMLAS
jgi:hypothetical protein